MASLNSETAGPILSAIYGLTDCLSDLEDRVLPYIGPTDDRIDYALAYEMFVVASATFSDYVVILLDLIDASMPD